MMQQRTRLGEQQVLGLNHKDNTGIAMKDGSGKWKGGRGFCGGISWNCIWLLLGTALLWFTFVAFQAGRTMTLGVHPLAFGFDTPWLQSRGFARIVNAGDERWSGDLRELQGAWNRLCFGPAQEHLRIACFVKKWPTGGAPGGMERHAMTLYRDLASRGHEVHVFTVAGNGDRTSDQTEGNLHVHFFEHSPSSGSGDQLWDRFFNMNSSSPFDIVHTESVALPHWRALRIPVVAASWHGIAAEAIHSDIVNDLIRKPGEPRSEDVQQNLFGRLSRIIEEIKFFRSYRHHVAISDYVADVLRTIYELPLEQVHTIFNGVDPNFQPDEAKGVAFRLKYGVPSDAKLVFGAAGRLVRDKGHPLLFEAFSEIMKVHPDVYLLVAGSGPWADRYKKLGSQVMALGNMPPDQLTDFYNAIDVFVNPTLRSMGLDTTLLEAMQCGKPLLATRFSSITWSVIVNKDFGYTFSPNVQALITAMEAMIRDGKDGLEANSVTRQEYAKLMFTANKMGSAYERLFLCFKNDKYCTYPLPTDCDSRSSGFLA